MADIALSQEDIDNLLGGGLEDDSESSADNQSADSFSESGSPSETVSDGSDNVFAGLDDLLPPEDSQPGSSAGSASAAPKASPQSSAPQFNNQSLENIGNLSALMNVFIDINVVLGKKKSMIKDILSLGEGSIIELDKSAGDPVDILANNRPLARGEVVVVDEQFGVRITEKVDPSEPLDSNID